MEERISFESRGFRLFGNLHLPHPGAPCVIFAHGLESSKDGRKWRSFAPRFAERGFGYLRFNFRGCGEGEERSEGELIRSDLSARSEDLLAALNFVSSRGAGEIGILGSSFGGMAALVAASGDPRPKALVLLATPLRLRGLREEGGEFILPSGLRVPPSFVQDVESRDLPALASKISIPALVIHGEGDDLVPVEDARILYKRLSGPKELRIIPGADHVFSDSSHLEEVLSLSLSWFERFLSSH